MIETMFSIILLPFAALAVVFTVAIGVGLIKGAFDAISKK
jgi:hypothetical protein